MPGFKAIQLIAKYLVVLVTYINFNIRALILIKYFKFIAYSYRQKDLVGFVKPRRIITGKLYRVPVDAGYFTTAIYGLSTATTSLLAPPGANVYIYEIPISQFSSEWDSSHLQSGIDTGQNVVQLSFTVMKSSSSQSQEAVLQTDDPCILLANYNYNSGIKVQDSGSRSDLIF